MLDRLNAEAVLRIGEVTEVAGQRVVVRVDKKKNVSDLLFDGDVLKNIAVNSYVEIRKGFVSLIGKVDGERLDEFPQPVNERLLQRTDRNRRLLQVSLTGFIDRDGIFRGGLRELPLLGNEVFIVTKPRLETIHNLSATSNASVHFAVTDVEGFDIQFPLDGLFNTHIAIFGNTGSGKSNTLAAMYSAFVTTLMNRNAEVYRQKTNFLLIDFNGEYVSRDCITPYKTVYRLSTADDDGDKLPLPLSALLDIEILSILADATEKTQKPFFRRALRLYGRVWKADKDETREHCRNLIKLQVRSILQMSDKQRSDLLIDYLEQILPEVEELPIRGDLEWYNVGSEWRVRSNPPVYLRSSPERIEATNLIALVDRFDFSEQPLDAFLVFLYIQLIMDVLSNRSQNEHIAPAINKLISKKADIEKVFDIHAEDKFWATNFVVVALDRVNIDMRKSIPLLLCKLLYGEHKKAKNERSLTFIIDEAHNILSTDSVREAESWKDYRLETFEEIIKEGRKFGVFVTISSQRPNDISPTITSQAHNYFIHRLVNQRDLTAIATSVSYIDKISEESIPTLPTGTCIFSGVAGQMPLKLRVLPLDAERQPRSNTLRFENIIPVRPAAPVRRPRQR